MKAKQLLSLLIAAVLLCGVLSACQSETPPVDDDTTPTTTAPQADNEPVEEPSFSWQTAEAYTADTATVLDIPFDQCRGTDHYICGFWNDLLLIKGYGNSHEYCYSYSLTTKKLTYIGKVGRSTIGSGESIVSEDGVFYTACGRSDNDGLLTVHAINLVNNTITKVDERESFPGLQYYVYAKDSAVWSFRPDRVFYDPDVTVGDDTYYYEYSIEKYDAKTGTTTRVVHKPNSKEQGISCTFGAGDKLYAYVYNTDGEDQLESYTLDGELLETLDLTSAKSTLSNRAIGRIAVYDDTLYFFWGFSANKMFVMERVGDELQKLELPLEKQLGGYEAPPVEKADTFGYFFTNNMLVRYDKESRTFFAHDLPEYDRKYVNNKGQVLLQVKGEKGEDDTYMLFENLTW